MTTESIVWDVVLALAFLFIGFGFSVLATKPKIRFSGVNWAQPRDGEYETDVTAISVPGFLGFQSKPRLGYTGKRRRLWKRRFVRWGRGFDRSTALDVAVYLIDEQTKQSVGNLEIIDHHGVPLEVPVAVESNGSIRAMLFEWQGFGPYSIRRSWHSYPPVQYSAPRTFRVEIHDRHGRLLRSKPFRMERHPQDGWVVDST